MIDGVITEERGELFFHGSYKDHHIEIERDGHDDDWYIIVTAPCGMRDYDGWWTGSGDRPLDDAIEEALAGAMLIEEKSQGARP